MFTQGDTIKISSVDDWDNYRNLLGFKFFLGEKTYNGTRFKNFVIIMSKEELKKFGHVICPIIGIYSERETDFVHCKMLLVEKKVF